MPAVGQNERKTRQRVVKLLREQLGYAYLGDWTHREGNIQDLAAYINSLSGNLKVGPLHRLVH